VGSASKPQGWKESEELIPGFEIEEELGRGGMGIVYRARTVPDGRLVALKLLIAQNPDPEELTRFELEASILSRLGHPAIVRFRGSGVHSGWPWFAMDLVEGEDLDQLVRRSLDETGEPPDPQSLGALLLPIAEAIQYCHERELVHRDIKPANILIAKDGRALLSDFGLVRAEGKSFWKSYMSLSAEGAIVGTPSFMAPEQLDQGGHFGNPGEAVDIWAFGAVLYFSLTGKLPFPGDSLLKLFRQINDETPPAPRSLNREIPAPLSELCMACLARHPSSRPCASELCEILADDSSYLVRKAAPSPKKGKKVAVFLAASALGLLLLGAFFARQGPSNKKIAAKTERPKKPGQTTESTAKPPASEPPELSSRLREINDAIRGSQLKSALSLASSLVLRAPRAPQPLVIRAQVWIVLDKIERARQDVRAALSIEPRNPEALAKQAAILAALGRSSEAKAAIEPLLREHPNNLDVLLESLAVRLVDNDTVRVLATAERLIAAQHEAHRAWAIKAIVAATAKRYVEALRLLEKAFEIAPNFSSGYRLQADFLFRLKRNTEAEAALRRALKLNPEDGLAAFGLARYLLSRERASEALPYIELAYEKFLGQRSQSQVANVYAGILQKLGKSEQALKILDETLSFAPGVAGLHYCKAVILYKIKRYKESRSAFDAGLNIHPIPIHYSSRAYASFHLADFEATDRDLLRLWKLKQPSFQILLAISEMELLRKRPERSLQAAKQAAMLKPERPEAHFRMAWAYAMLNRSKEAIKNFQLVSEHSRSTRLKKQSKGALKLLKAGGELRMPELPN